MVDRQKFDTLAQSKYGEKFEQLDAKARDELFEKFEEKYESFGDESLALTAAVGSFNFDRNMSGATPDSERIVAVGCNGPRPFGDEDSLFCYGVVFPEDSKPGRIVVIVDESDVDGSLVELAELWTPFTEIEGEVSLREASQVGGVTEGSSAYIGEIGRSDSPFEEAEELRWEDEAERKENVMYHIDTVQISDIGDNLTLVGDNGYPSNFGLDFKCIERSVVLEANVTARGARYVFQDDSFLEPDELPKSVRGDDNDIGLVGWTEPHIAESVGGQESIVDVFGTVTPDDGGHITLGVLGADAHSHNPVEVPEEPQDTGQDSGTSTQSRSDSTSQASSEAMEERSI